MHRIKWYVYTGGTDANGRPERIRREASMRGTWPGYDAECTCGWESRTGGAVRQHVADRVAAHKWDVEYEASLAAAAVAK